MGGEGGGFMATISRNGKLSSLVHNIHPDSSLLFLEFPSSEVPSLVIPGVTNVNLTFYHGKCSLARPADTWNLIVGHWLLTPRVSTWLPLSGTASLFSTPGANLLILQAPAQSS